MVNNLFDTFSEQAKNMVEPAFKLNQLVLTNTEKLARAQMECLTSYAELGIEQLREAASIKEFTELKDFLTKQAEVAGDLSKKMSEDANKLMSIGMEIRDDITKFSQENTKEFSVEPIKPVKKAAK